MGPIYIVNILLQCRHVCLHNLLKRNIDRSVLICICNDYCLRPGKDLSIQNFLHFSALKLQVIKVIEMIIIVLLQHNYEYYIII